MKFKNQQTTRAGSHAVFVGDMNKLFSEGQVTHKDIPIISEKCICGEPITDDAFDVVCMISEDGSLTTNVSGFFQVFANCQIGSVDHTDFRLEVLVGDTVVARSAFGKTDTDSYRSNYSSMIFVPDDQAVSARLVNFGEKVASPKGASGSLSFTILFYTSVEVPFEFGAESELETDNEL